MRHPVKWQCNAARRVFIIVAFPLTLFILSLAWLLQAAEKFWEVACLDSRSTFNTAKRYWKTPKQTQKYNEDR